MVLPASALTVLDLSDSACLHLDPDADNTDFDFDSRSAAVLSHSLPYSNLKELYLRNNKIGDGGALTLAEATADSKLMKLDIANNSISDVGTLGFLKALRQGHL